MVGEFLQDRGRKGEQGGSMAGRKCGQENVWGRGSVALEECHPGMWSGGQ